MNNTTTALDILAASFECLVVLQPVFQFGPKNGCHDTCSLPSSYFLNSTENVKTEQKSAGKCLSASASTVSYVSAVSFQAADSIFCLYLVCDFYL